MSLFLGNLTSIRDDALRRCCLVLHVLKNVYIFNILTGRDISFFHSRAFAIFVDENN